MSEASLGTPPAAAPAAAPASSSEPAKPDAQQPAADPAKEPSAAPAKPEPTRAETRKSAAQALREKFGAKDEPEPAKPPEPKPAAAEPARDTAQRGPDGKFAPKAGEPAAAKPAEAKPAPQPPAAPKPADGELEGRLARTVRELNNSTAQANDYKRKHDMVAAENTSLKAKYEAAKANPYDLLEELGWDLERIAKETVEQKIKPRGQRMELPPEIKQQLDELKADKEAREQREHAERIERMRTNESAKIKQYIEQNAERFPFAAAHDWAAGSVWHLASEGGRKAADALPVLQALEVDLAANTAAVLGNERALKALLTSQPKLRESLIAALGISTSNEATPAASNGAGKGGADSPRSLSNLPSGGSAPPSAKPTKEQLRAEAKRAWEQERQRQAAE